MIRRGVIVGWACLWASGAWAASVESIGLTVSKLERSIAFYENVLGFKASPSAAAGAGYDRLIGLPGAKVRWAVLRLGGETLVLSEFISPKGRPAPSLHSNDRWFQHVAIIVSDMDKAFARLEAHGVKILSRGGPQRLPDWNKNAGGIRACYFADPDGHPLEILWFPPGKGDPKWQQRATGNGSPATFLGIDHTAIVVGSTTDSLAFYRDHLGFSVRGNSENYGPEQERLNNVEGAHLRITSVGGDSGPAVEFLEYLEPKTGRPYPAEARPNDLIHWQTHVSLDKTTSTGPSAESFVDWTGTPTRGRLVRDPDHHAVLEVQR